MAASNDSALVFRCGSDALVGVLNVPEHNRAETGVLIVVGGPQYRVGSHRQFVLMARGLAQAGYPVLRFDYRGMGDSDGEVRTFESIDEDIRAALDAFIASVPGLTGIVLWGLCDAASAALLYCTKDDRVKGLILANPWVRSQAGQAQSYLKHYYGQRLLQRSFWLKAFSGKLNVTSSAADFLRKLWHARGGNDTQSGSGSFVERMRHGLQRFTGPALILMSERDLTAQEFRDLCSASRTWQRAIGRPNVSVVDLDGADHTFSSRPTLDRATCSSVDWLNRKCRPRA